RVRQDAYIDGMKQISIAKSRSAMKGDDLTTEECAGLKKFAGQMLWVTSQTRPDLSFEICMISNTGKNHKVSLLCEANKALSKLNRDRVCLHFPALGDYRKLSVIVYCDATHASMADGSSNGGHIVFLKGANAQRLYIANTCEVWYSSFSIFKFTIL
ncbi:unnamed protein product, partial [Meganyctiphanes norvegica]